MVVTPADQTIADEAAFQADLQQAVQVAEGGSIVILGVTPTKPETGYGYNIQVAANDANDGAAHPVQRFVEKPDVSTAQRYLSEGGYFWNAGMFVLKASVWLKALEGSLPARHYRPGSDIDLAIVGANVTENRYLSSKIDWTTSCCPTPSTFPCCTRSATPA